MINTQISVAATVLDHSECAAVFQRHRIDFCCKGKMTIADACAEQGVDADALVGELEAAIAGRHGAAPDDPRQLSTAVLIAHIVTTHHDYLRRALPFIRALASKVGRVHGEHNPRLVELANVVEALDHALLPHLDQEEQVLFPALMVKTPDRTQLRHELDAMLSEHLAVGALLERMRDATEDYALPDWVCNSYRTLFSELRRLEEDVLRHVHLENHVLMPRFVGD